MRKTNNKSNVLDDRRRLVEDVNHLTSLGYKTKKIIISKDFSKRISAIYRDTSGEYSKRFEVIRFYGIPIEVGKPSNNKSYELICSRGD